MFDFTITELKLFYISLDLLTLRLLHYISLQLQNGRKVFLWYAGVVGESGERSWRSYFPPFHHGFLSVSS